MDSNSVLGVVLVGGRSTRMGRDKALVELRGRPLHRWVAAALEEAGCEVVAAGRSRPVGSLRTIPDPPDSRRGPIVGLHAASQEPHEAILLVATDQPLLRPDTVTGLIAVDGAVVAPVDGDVVQVTCALYRPALIGFEAIGSASSLQALVTSADSTLVPAATWRGWGEDGRSWFSVDTPAALEQADAMLA